MTPLNGSTRLSADDYNGTCSPIVGSRRVDEEVDSNHDVSFEGFISLKGIYQACHGFGAEAQQSDGLLRCTTQLKLAQCKAVNPKP